MNLSVKLFHFFAGMALVGIGLLLGLLGLLAVVDPAGTKMADDSDPFGSTAGIVPMGIVILVIAIAIIAGGAYLILKVGRKQ